MTRTILLIGLTLLLAGSPAFAERLDPDEIYYLGRFFVPPPTGEGPAGMWSWGLRGLTLIPDCMGHKDPTPDDGFPGCVGAFGHDHAGLFGVFDLVPPGSQARQVVPFYDLGGSLPRKELEGIGEVRYWDVLYDRAADHCRLWWTFGTWYIRIQDDPPFLGFSSCDAEHPRPQGMWGFGKRRGNMQSDPFHSAKFHRTVSRIPEPVAKRHFDGLTMMLGIGFTSGARGGSQGPSAYVRPMTVPTSNPAQDLVPLLWYRHTAYVKWYDKPEMDGGAMRHWTDANASGIEWVDTEPAGEGESPAEAAVVAWQTPTINPDDYPCSDPTAYRDNDPRTPEPCEVPVCWYGLQECRDGAPEFQQPSFWEDTSSGKPMPKDCKLRDDRDHTGPHCLSRRPFLLLYDVDELARVYRGELEHNKPQPYAAIPLEKFMRGAAAMGTTYDPQRRRLYLSEGGDNPLIRVFSIGKPSRGRAKPVSDPEPTARTSPP